MLARQEMLKIVPEFYDYVEGEIAQYLDWLPPAVRKAVEQWGVSAGEPFGKNNTCRPLVFAAPCVSPGQALYRCVFYMLTHPLAALNITLDATREFIPDRFFEMAHAIEDEVGFPRDHVLKLSLFPELIKMGCSMFGAWNDASADGTGLLQLRALDWDSDSPAQQFPAVINYHPSGDGNVTEHSYSVVGWVGLLGAVSGYSSAGMALSEKVWLSYDGLENIVGVPATYLLEDILRHDLDTDQSLARIASANRTCSIFIGLGDEYNNEFKVVQYGYEHVNIWNWRTCPTWENHDRFTDLVFVDKHVQPSTHPCLNDLMHQLYGDLDAAATVYITSLFETGDTHIAIYDFEAKEMYVSNAAPTNASAIASTLGDEAAAKALKDNKAYNQPFVRFDMNWMWNASLATVQG